MGRALAVSKLESVKSKVQSLTQNIKSEASVIESAVTSMLKKHQPHEIEIGRVDSLEKKATEIIA